MAEYSTPEQRTEMPTSRRMSQLRREGALHMSSEVICVVSLLSGFYLISYSWKWFWKDLQACMIDSYRSIGDVGEFTINSVYNKFLSLLLQFGPDIAFIVVGVCITSTLAVMLQTNWNIKAKKLHFNLDLIHPIQGIKKIFSIQGFINVAKSILKLLLILPMAYVALKKFAPDMVKLIHMSIPSILVYAGTAITYLFWKILYVLIAMALFDYFYGKYRWLKQNKMTKDEVKDEQKAIEGDEATKRKIIAKGMQRIMQRIMNSVPKADVVVTNPTHYAVALKYDRATMTAPVVVAKGKGFLALRIREIAKQSGVPVLERKSLARALYGSVEIGTEIPHGLFRAVAEVLAYVYKLRNPHAQYSTR